MGIEIIEKIYNCLSQQKEEFTKTLNSGRRLYLLGRKEMKEELKKMVEGMRELHRHNSIPSYIADLEDGCQICIKNQALEEIIKAIEEL